VYRVQYVTEAPYRLIWEETVDTLPQAGDGLIRSDELANTFVEGIILHVELSVFDWINNLQAYPQHIAVVSTKICTVRGKKLH
jgi:hypothetical protein